MMWQADPGAPATGIAGLGQDRAQRLPIVSPQPRPFPGSPLRSAAWSAPAQTLPRRSPCRCAPDGDGSGFETVTGVEALAPRQHQGRLSKAGQRLHGAQLQLQHSPPAASACCTAVLQGVHMPSAALAWQHMEEQHVPPL